jgi:hypothetical protein
MRKLMPKLSYANVVSTLALCIAVGGASAFAATQLAKNSVGTKQLKKNAVTAVKIKNGAVTGPKIKDGAITGAKVNSSTLGTVPVAQRANTLTAPEPWHEIGKPGEPTFLNGWSNEGLGSVDAAFYRDAGGVVHLRGGLEGSDNTAAFFLPAGFRTGTYQGFPAYGAPEAVVSIRSDGSVTPFCDGVGNCHIGLEGITFRAEG